jgi:hypothetical protein
MPMRKNLDVPFLAFLASAACLLAPGAALAAGHPDLASYSADQDRIFWFLHVADIHIGSGDAADENLSLLANEAQDVIRPWFTIVTGDMVEDGRQGEWERYRSIVTDAGLGPDRWFDLPGNHDNNLDGDDFDPGFLDYYFTYSISGAVDGQVHHAWAIDTGFGLYQLVGVYTDCEAGRLISAEELDFALASFEGETEARLAFVGGHHPMEGSEAADPASCLALQELMQDQGVSLYMFGHVHSIVEALWPHVYTGYGYLSWLTPTAGKPEILVSPAGFSLIAVDSDAVSARVFFFHSPLLGADELPMPMVLVTAPADWGYGGNPYAYPVSAASPDNPVRALVFSDGAPDAVSFRVAGRPWQPMTLVDGPLWAGTFDGAGLPVGVDLTLEVTVDDGGGEDTHAIVVRAVAAAACQDGMDNDGDGATDFPEDPGCTGGFDSDEREPYGVPPYVPSAEDETAEAIEEAAEPADGVEDLGDAVDATIDPDDVPDLADEADDAARDADDGSQQEDPEAEEPGGEASGCGCAFSP